jgi:hypothetical protein
VYHRGADKPTRRGKSDHYSSVPDSIADTCVAVCGAYQLAVSWFSRIIRVIDADAACTHQQPLGCGDRTRAVTTRLRVLDDGAWISINDSREVRVGDLWRLDSPDFCACALSDLVVENIQTVGVNGRAVETRVYGQCITCGETGITGWLPVGTVRAGEFLAIDRDAIR